MTWRKHHEAGGGGGNPITPAPPDLITGDDIHHRPNNHHDMVINLRTIGRIQYRVDIFSSAHPQQSLALHAMR